MIGVSLDSSPIYLITEYMAKVMRQCLVKILNWVVDCSLWQ